MKKAKILIGLILLFNCFAAADTAAQNVVDKTVATVSDGIQSELITYSDLLWQLALQPDTPINEPRKDDLEAALQTVIEQRLIALEAERLPTVAPTDDKVNAEIRRLVAQFPAASVFETRLRRVGFDSIEDPNFRRIIEQRVAVENYLDFRFRSFIVITPADEEQFYKEVYIPRFRRSNPNVVVPELEKVRTAINQEITEQRIETEINRFLEDARNRASVTMLYPI